MANQKSITTKKLSSELRRTISSVQIRIYSNNLFLGALALFAEVEACDDIPTVVTNGKKILINELFFSNLDTREQEFYFLHELLHAALLHVPRGRSRDQERWNLAADFVVNGALAQQGYQIPATHVYDNYLAQFAVEEVYELLARRLNVLPRLTDEMADLLYGNDIRQANDTQNRAKAASPRNHSSVDGQKTLSIDDSEGQLESYWQNALKQLHIIGETTQMGKMPAILRRMIDNTGSSQINWRQYLWRYLVRTPVDFEGYDRRFVGRGIYLDALADERLNVAIAIDTSGSINPNQLRTFVSEVRAVLSAYPHITCELFYIDTVLHGPWVLTTNSTLPDPIGGGGTDFRPFFRYLVDNMRSWNNTVALFLTDGHGRFPPEPPDVSVLWVVTPGGLQLSQFPFGESVRLLTV